MRPASEVLDDLDVLLSHIQEGMGESDAVRDLAEKLRSADRIYAHIENKVANENVHYLRQDGYCPVCGADGD